MKIKKVVLIILVIFIVLGIGIILFKGKENKNVNDNKIKVVASNFASYDFLRAIIGDNKDVDLTFLLGPGKEAHSYEPTAGDLLSIQNSDLFVYIGGDSEKWANKVLEALENNHNKKVMCIAEVVDKLEEQEIDGAEDEEEEEEEGAFDDHIWTSPSNAIKMVNTLEEAMEEIDENNKKEYKDNAESYIAKIKEIDNKIQEIVDNKVRDRLVFADKMPMQYFINYYKLNVSAAFSGCSTETEPSAKTIAYLEKVVKEENIPIILYIELNPGRVAKTIADETDTKAMQIQTLHNVSLDDFKNGETWVSLMERNLDVLKQALQ